MQSLNMTNLRLKNSVFLVVVVIVKCRHVRRGRGRRRELTKLKIPLQGSLPCSAFLYRTLCILLHRVFHGEMFYLFIFSRNCCHFLFYFFSFLLSSLLGNTGRERKLVVLLSSKKKDEVDDDIWEAGHVSRPRSLLPKFNLFYYYYGNYYSFIS